MDNEARKVFLALPVHDQTVCASLLTSLITDISLCMNAGYQFHVLCHGQDSNPAHARNVILGTFMASDCVELISIDHDISWPAGSLQRLLSHPVDFVGGAYRYKVAEERYPISWLKDFNDPRTLEGLVQVARIPGGFVRMTRKGLERIIAKSAHLEFESHVAPGMTCWYLYHEKLENRGLVTEDFVFCDHLREMGEQIWLDPELKLDHTGKTTYRGNLDGFIAEINRQKLPDEARKAHDAKLIQFAQSLATPEMQRLFKVAMGEAA